MNKSKKLIMNQHASSDIEVYVQSKFPIDKIENFQRDYDRVRLDYFTNPQTKILSSIDFKTSNIFNQWLPTAVKNIDLVIPQLISHMLSGDIYSLGMYEGIYEYQSKRDLLLTYDKIHNNSNLKEKFIKYGNSEEARAILSAEEWYQTEEAAKIFHASELSDENNAMLCVVGELLRVSNSFFHCDDSLSF